MSDDLSKDMQFDENDYARPNQPWICGRAADGQACPLGPTKGGGCRSAYECAPYRQGDTWLCARTRSRGGVCQEGPLSDGTCCRPIHRCRPKRSVLAKRGVLSFCVFALALGVALVMVASPKRNELVSPGKLTSQHSTVVHGCKKCHDLGRENEDRLSGWIHSAFDSRTAARQSELCLICHRDLGKQAIHPHGRPPQELDEITKRLASADSTGGGPLVLKAARIGFGRPAQSHDKIACAACHREHHGVKNDLTQITNHQCQSCHTDTFHSFGRGHPEFSHYPYQRRTRLYFDHLSHYGNHFKQAGENVGRDSQRLCSECHTPDSAGRNMLVLGFEKSCASCHTEQIEDDTLAGFSLAAIPGLDLETLASKNIPIGDWPALYPLHVEATGELTPLIHLLLQSQEGFEEIAQQLEGVDLSDLREATPAQLQAVEKFAWSFKETMHDVVMGGQPEIYQRIHSLLAAGDVDSPLAADNALAADNDVEELVKRIPLEMLAEMQQRWLPRLAAEVTAHRNGAALPENDKLPPRNVGKVLADAKRTKLAVTSGWYLRESDLSLRYRPTGHADETLKTFLDAAAHLTSVTKNENKSSSQAVRKLFASLSSPHAGGRCMKCHTADSPSQGEVQIHWRAFRPSPSERTFTRFQHAPHVTFFSNELCFRCHQFDNDSPTKERIYREQYVQSDWSLQTDPHRFKSNFLDMTKASCAECHTRMTAGDSCLTCHNYHIR